MIVLVTGCCGLLGEKIMGYQSDLEYVGLDLKPTLGHTHHQVDITKKDEVGRVFSEVNPDVVFHTAALTNVDYCERNRGGAWRVNVEGSRNIAEAASDAGAKIVYLSTDFIFDGRKGMCLEEDEAAPVNYYGVTKLEGESIIEGSGLDYVIARTSVLYGWSKVKSSYVTWVIDSLKNGRHINIVVDQFNSPTLADNLVEMLHALMDKRGIYHTAGCERISRYDFAVKIAKTFRLNKKLIHETTSGKFEQDAPRPRDCSLDVSKAQTELGVEILDVYGGLNMMKNQIIKAK